MKEQHIDLAEQRLKGPLTEKALDRLDEALDTEKGEKLANVCFKILHHAGVKNAEREQTPLLARQEGAQLAAASITGLLSGMKHMFSGNPADSPEEPLNSEPRAKHAQSIRSRAPEEEEPQFRITSPVNVGSQAPEDEEAELLLDQSRLEELYGGDDE